MAEHCARVGVVPDLRVIAEPVRIIDVHRLRSAISDVPSDVRLGHESAVVNLDAHTVGSARAGRAGTVPVDRSNLVDAIGDLNELLRLVRRGANRASGRERQSRTGLGRRGRRRKQRQRQSQRERHQERKQRAGRSEHGLHDLPFL